MLNLEVLALRDGLQRIHRVQSSKDDAPDKKLAIMELASIVGRALREIRNAADTLDDGRQDLLLKYAKRDDKDRPVPSLNDKGEANGVILADPQGYQHEHRALLRLDVDIPPLVGVTYQLLARAGVEVDGELVEQLGDFISGDPVTVALPKVTAA